eukprot:GEMP01016308.1.p1 GENE.GEMP01016308.1~~GEMP01016308.1.p1  ORF type:complete len:397 (+),score=87.99 GEMP01016308.1:52-1191(+)
MDFLGQVEEGVQVHVPVRKTNKHELRVEKEENPLLSSETESAASLDEKCELIRAEDVFEVNLDYSSSEYDEVELKSALGATHVIISATRAVSKANRHAADHPAIVRDVMSVSSFTLCAFDPTNPLVPRDKWCTGPALITENADGDYEGQWGDSGGSFKGGNKVKIRRHVGQDAICVALLNENKKEIGRTEPLNLRFPTLRFTQAHGVRKHGLDMGSVEPTGTIWISVELYPSGSTLPPLVDNELPYPPKEDPPILPDAWVCVFCNGEGWQVCGECHGTRHKFCRHCYGKEELFCGECAGMGWKEVRVVGIGHRFGNSMKCDQALPVISRKRCEVCWGMPILCPKCFGVGHVKCPTCVGLGCSSCSHCRGRSATVPDGAI